MSRATSQLGEHAHLERRIQGETLCTALEQTAQRWPSMLAYSDMLGAGGALRTLTWHQFRGQALDLAAGLIAAGVPAGARVAIMASDRIEHVLADAAVVHAGCVPVPIYGTSSPEQIISIAKRCTPTAVILEGADQLARWKQTLDRLHDVELVVVVEHAAHTDPRVVSWGTFASDGANFRADSPEVCESAWRTVNPASPATVLFTSGTTGEPKGVVLTHQNILYEVHAMLAANELDDAGVSVTYLPFAHIAERILGIYLPQTGGGHVRLLADATQLAETLRQVRPTRFFGVPRIWEKLRDSASAMIEADEDHGKRVVTEALRIGRHYVESLQDGGAVTEELEKAFIQADEAILAPLRTAIGLDRLQWATTAAAPMPIDILQFFAGLGIRIYDVYGMTETTASAVVNTSRASRIGSVGRPLPGIDVRISAEGEILIRGPITTPGYYGDDRATDELFDAGDWLHTGDVGRLDDDGYLYITGRIKELIVTSSGKNIAPSMLEDLLKQSGIVGNALVYGDGQPYLVALLIVDPDAASRALAGAGVVADPDDPAALSGHPQVTTLVERAIADANTRVSRPEQVKKFVVLNEEWTVDGGELTPTLKLKRGVVTARHADVIEALYQQKA